MSTLGTIASKTYGAAALEERNLVLEPGVAYQRLTTLPDNWKTVRIALVLSFTNTSELNGEPVTENPYGATSVYLQPWFGLTNGAGMPGTAGVKFVGSGMGKNENWYPCTLSKSSGWILSTNGDGQGLRGAGTITDGETIVRSGNSSRAAVAKFDTPTETTNFAFAWMTELTAGADGTLIRNQQIIGNVSDPILAMNQALSLAPAYGESSATGGWWNNSTTFCGCKHLFIRFPFLNNRLRIHALRVMQLA